MRFGYLLKPCKVTVKDKATTGKAVCPALVAYNGDQVSMTFEWGA
jgi:ferredoxin-thioredoxin reductase catalytic subunit